MKKLIVPLFPVFGYEGKVPYWVHELVSQRSTYDYLTYDVRRPLNAQGDDLLEFLSTKKVSKRARKGFVTLHDKEHLEFFSDPLDTAHLACFADDHMGDVAVLRDSYVIARAAAVVLDVNNPGYGEHVALAMVAGTMGIPVIVVNDRVLTPPAFPWLATGVVSSTRVGKFLRKFLRLSKAAAHSGVSVDLTELDSPGSESKTSNEA